MKTLGTVQCGTKGLEGVLNRMVEGINARSVTAGAGLTATEHPDGVTISLASQDDSGGGNQQGGGGGGRITWLGVTFRDVDVMDAGCNKSTISVLVWTGNANDSITIG